MYPQIKLYRKVTFNLPKAKSKLTKRASLPKLLVNWNKTSPKTAFHSLISHVMKLINLTSIKKKIIHFIFLGKSKEDKGF